MGEENLKNYKELGIGHIRIGVSTSLCKHILLDYLKDFIRENPNIKFSIDCHSTVNTIKLLKNDDIDIGLICNTELPKGIVYSPIKEIHDVFVASPEYLDNFYERNGNALDDMMDELSPHIKGNIIPLLGASKRAVKNTSSDSLYNDSDSAAALENMADHVLTKATTDNPTDSSLPNHSNITTTDILENSNLMVLEEANVTRTHVDEQLSSGVITELPLDTPIPCWSVGFAYSGMKNQSTAMKKFMEWVGV